MFIRIKAFSICEAAILSLLPSLLSIRCLPKEFSCEKKENSQNLLGHISNCHLHSSNCRRPSNSSYRVLQISLSPLVWRIGRARSQPVWCVFGSHPEDIWNKFLVFPYVFNNLFHRRETSYMNTNTSPALGAANHLLIQTTSLFHHRVSAPCKVG